MKSGRPDLAKFKEIIDVIIPLVKDVKHEEYSFQVDDDKGIFKDEDADSMYFYNIKIKSEYVLCSVVNYWSELSEVFFIYF